MSSREVRPKDLLRVLKKLGFVVRRQKGSHVFLEKIVDDQTFFTSISLHNRPLPRGTFRAILRQTGVSIEDIKKYLR